MGLAPQLLFPGAILGSIVLTLFTFMVTAGISIPPVQAAEAAHESSTLQIGGTINYLPAVSTSVLGAMSQQTEEEPPHEQLSSQAEEALQDDCNVSSKYPEKILRWCDIITHFSRANQLDPDLIAALIWQESGGNPEAYSRSGAVGLMQVMPRDGIAANFMCKNGPCFTKRPSIAELQDPDFNVRYGTGMLANLLARHGNMRDALKYYGPMDVGYYYADKVLGIYENYRK